MSSEGDGHVDSEHKASRADVIGALAIIAGAAAIAFVPRLVVKLSAHPTALECDALLARYVKMKERSVSEKVDSKHYAAALEDARRLAGPAFAACTTEVTLDEAECARTADDADKMERCLR